ncbi:MAG: TetR/AcrR family transcriptional regulator [Desulfosporosinus sp.]|nr:TetR/AcrR family transcriptional regulator [Desulfosporosinus sp.]
MSRIAEPEKIEHIKKATMEALIEHGYGGMAIESISKRAGVSAGYLYRHFKSKEELVQVLVDSAMDEIIDRFISDIDSSNSLYEAGYKTIDRLFMKANQEPLLAKFSAAVVLDIKIPSKDKADNFKSILELAEKCILLGLKTGELNSKISALEVLVVSFTIPFRYLSISLEINNCKIFTSEEVKRVAEMCLNALK